MYNLSDHSGISHSVSFHKPGTYDLSSLQRGTEQFSSPIGPGRPHRRSFSSTPSTEPLIFDFSLSIQGNLAASRGHISEISFAVFGRFSCAAILAGRRHETPAGPDIGLFCRFSLPIAASGILQTEECRPRGTSRLKY